MDENAQDDADYLSRNTVRVLQELSVVRGRLLKESERIILSLQRVRRRDHEQALERQKTYAAKILFLESEIERLTEQNAELHRQLNNERLRNGSVQKHDESY